ncbi:MAG: nucleotidyl transferase AbiEii/AbiGii toxin family protein [Sphaerochaeta sp.]|nr:nucleotidyl transferase AbiEii/AbiGii toxin family protein [Sphaerochaeta sp.]
MVFKGGTSLSKSWHVIERFSEDIDIALDRQFLGYGGILTKTQIHDKLRRASCSFVRNDLSKAVRQALLTLGVSDQDFKVIVYPTSVSTVDPEKIHVEYRSVYSKTNAYTPNRVLIEAGARSITALCKNLPIQSFIGEMFSSEEFADVPIEIPTTDASRTFLEKAFLLHEEFHSPAHTIRNDRMSRHIYDLERMMDTDIGFRALQNLSMYRDIIEHRRRFIGLKGFDYDSLFPQFIDFIPPVSVLAAWERDYQIMRENMIYGKSLTFTQLLERITELNKRFTILSAP